MTSTGVQKKRQAARLDALVYREKRGVGQVFAENLRGDIEAAHAGELCGTLDFPHSKRGFVHWQRGEADEPPCIALVRPRERVVVSFADALRQFSISPVPMGCDNDSA